MIQVHCAGCGKTFLRTPERVAESKKQKWQSYCSNACQFRLRLRGTFLICSNPECKKSFYRRRSQVKKVIRCFCSTSCAAIVNNALKRQNTMPKRHCANSACAKGILNDLTYCSRACFSQVRTVFTPEDLLLKLKNTAQRLGRTPTKREFGPAAYMCIRAFQSWNASLIAASLIPYRSDSERMFKRRKTRAQDGHLCDSISEAIIDNWLTEHGIPHKRNASYPSTGHLADWSLDGHIFVEYFGLANDSPRYDQSIVIKRKLCKKHHITLIELYPSDLYPVIRLAGKLRDFTVTT